MQLLITLFSIVALIAFLHMLAPDHWLPLIILSAKRKFSTGRKYIYSFGIGTIHALSSISLSFIVSFFIYSYIVIAIKIIIYIAMAFLIIIGLYFIINGYRENEMNFESSNILGVSIIPDIAVFPIILISFGYSMYDTEEIILLFYLVSIITLLTITYLATISIGNFLQRIKPKYSDYIIGIILISLSLLLLPIK